MIWGISPSPSPPGFHRTSAQGIDSDCREFDGPGMRVDTDYGLYSGFPLDHLRTNEWTFRLYASYVSHMEQIAGHEVQVVSRNTDLSHGASHGAVFPYFMEASFLGFGLTAYVGCETTNDYEIATEIFRSVKFKR